MTDDVRREEEKCYSYDEAVELTGHGRYNRVVLAACSLAIHAAALDMFGFSVTVAAAACDLRLALPHAGVLASAPFAGALIFALPWGYYADTRGRRRALLVASTGGFVMAVLCSFATSWPIMFAFKFIGCSFSAALYSQTMTYLGECTGQKHRSQYLHIMNSFNLASEIVSFAVAYIFLGISWPPLSWFGTNFSLWRLYTLVLTLPLGLSALLMVFLYESPKFLASRGETDQLLEVLKKIYAVNRGKEEEYPVKFLVTEEKPEQASLCSSVLAQTLPLFRPPLVWRTLQLFYLMSLCCATNNVFVMYFPMMVNMLFNSLDGTLGSSFCERIFTNGTTGGASEFDCNQSISPHTIYSGILYGVFFTVLNLSISGIAAWRKSLLVSILAVSALSAALVNLVHDPIANMIFFTLLQGTALGTGAVASYFVDLYPTAFRGLATSLGMMVARLSSFAGINLVGAVIAHRCTLTFYCCALYVLTGIVVTLLLPADGKIKQKMQVIPDGRS